MNDEVKERQNVAGMAVTPVRLLARAAFFIIIYTYVDSLSTKWRSEHIESYYQYER